MERGDENVMSPGKSGTSSRLRKRLRKSLQNKGDALASLRVNTETGAGDLLSGCTSDGTPFPSERFAVTTYTTYGGKIHGRAVKYTTYAIREQRQPSIHERTEFRDRHYQTTYKTPVNGSWYVKIHNWSVTPTSPVGCLSPKRNIRSLKDLSSATLSPRRFSLDGTSTI